MQLLERDDVLQRVEELFASARDGDGHAVLVRGEAGIGKTSAVRTVTDAHSEDAHILWGLVMICSPPSPWALSGIWHSMSLLPAKPFGVRTVSRCSGVYFRRD